MFIRVVSVVVSSVSSFLFVTAEPGVADETNVDFSSLSQKQLDRQGDETTASEMPEIYDFIYEQAARGVLLDASNVKAATVDDSTVAWSENVEPSLVQFASAEEAESAATEIAIVAEPSDQLMLDSPVLFGSRELSDPEGFANRWGGCVTASSRGNHASNCWDLYKAKDNRPDRNYFYYGRYVIATGESRDYRVDQYPKLIDIRSRPTTGTSDRVFTAIDYFPFVGGDDCSSTSVGVGVAGFSATLPISNCKRTVVTPDGKAIKVEMNEGTCADNRSEGVDLGISVATDPEKPRVAYSDYTYVRFSNTPVTKCDAVTSDDDRLIFTDPGW